jgi:hypothetical protein
MRRDVVQSGRSYWRFRGSGRLLWNTGNLMTTWCLKRRSTSTKIKGDASKKTEIFRREEILILRTFYIEGLGFVYTKIQVLISYSHRLPLTCRLNKIVASDLLRQNTTHTHTQHTTHTHTHTHTHIYIYIYSSLIHRRRHVSVLAKHLQKGKVSRNRSEGPEEVQV